MSKRRSPGEIVQRTPGSGFISSEKPQLIKVPLGKAFEMDTIKDPETGAWILNPGGEATWCMLNCGDVDCREWTNLEIIKDGKGSGDFLYHISECQMFDG